jgi:MFS family permease
LPEHIDAGLDVMPDGGVVEHVSAGGHPDFRRLWAGLAISQIGSGIGQVALPVVAVTVVRASPAEVSLLAAITAVTIALTAFPLGAHVEFRRKRPIMIASDVARCLSAASVPIVAAFGGLTFAQLCAVAVVNAIGLIAFSTAAGAHLRNLVPGEMLIDANGRLQASQWLTLTTGASLGGLIIAFLGAARTLLVDSASFVVDALVIRSLRQPEPVPPTRGVGVSRRAELLAGLAFVRHHPSLRRILTSWVLFSGASAMAAPIATVFYLRTLHFTEWQYGLLMGVPSLGGFLGARLGILVTRRFGPVRGIFGASVLRTPWFFLTPLARPGAGGLLLCGIAFTASLVFSSLSNSTMAGYRHLVTPDALQARTAALWSFATVATSPLFVLVGAALVAAVQPRIALFVSATLMAASVVLLPRRERVAPERADALRPAPRDRCEAMPLANSMDDGDRIG